MYVSVLTSDSDSSSDSDICLVPLYQTFSLQTLIYPFISSFSFSVQFSRQTIKHYSATSNIGTVSSYLPIFSRQYENSLHGLRFRLFLRGYCICLYSFADSAAALRVVDGASGVDPSCEHPSSRCNPVPPRFSLQCRFTESNPHPLPVPAAVSSDQCARPRIYCFLCFLWPSDRSRPFDRTICRRQIADREPPTSPEPADSSP